MKTRSGPVVEHLEVRQLPYSSLSAASFSFLHQPTDGGDVGHVSGSVPDFFPTPPIGNSPWAQAKDPSYSNDPTNNTVLQVLKGDSVRPNHAEKPVCLSEHSSAHESLRAEEVRASYSSTKRPERSLSHRQGRLSIDELPSREVDGAPVDAKRLERSIRAVYKRFSSEATAAAEKRANRLLSRPQREEGSGELASIFSSLVYDLATAAISFRLVAGGWLNAKRVEGFFSSMEYGSLSTLLPGSEGELLDLKPVEELPASLWDALPGLGPSVVRTERPGKGRRAEGREDLSIPPLYLSVVLRRQSGKPLDPSAQQGLDRLCAYAWSSIRNAERAHGEKFLSPEDIVQEIYLEWRGLVGQQPEDEALARLLQDGSEEMKLLRRAVRRVIGRTRYQQRQWTKAADINQSVDRSAVFARRGEQERVDWEDLWENVVSTLSPHEKQILELRKQGKTFAEIGSALGLPRQRVCETYHSVVARLQKNYPDW